MEHAWNIKCGKMKTMEVWEDEEHLKKGLNKILSGTFFVQKHHSKITESDMRSMLRRSIRELNGVKFQISTAGHIVRYIRR